MKKFHIEYSRADFRRLPNLITYIHVVLVVLCLTIESEALFKGIVKKLGTVKGFRLPAGGDRIVDIQADGLESLEIGDSIACSGVCLTVMNITGDVFKVAVSLETTDHSNLGNWTLNRKINLEQAMRFTDRIDGHLLMGHVDDMARIESIQLVYGSRVLNLTCSPELMPFIAKKGSVALDGVSLTVNEVGDGAFSVNIVPFTWKTTTFQYNNVGDYVNLEVDIIARYLYQMQQSREKKMNS